MLRWRFIIFGDRDTKPGSQEVYPAISQFMYFKQMHNPNFSLKKEIF